MKLSTNLQLYINMKQNHPKKYNIKHINTLFLKQIIHLSISNLNINKIDSIIFKYI